MQNITVTFANDAETVLSEGTLDTIGNTRQLERTAHVLSNSLKTDRKALGMGRMTLENNQLLDILRWRYAVKRFDPSRTIDESIWSTLEHALILTPSSFGLQPWKFLVLRSPEIKAKLPAMSWNQSQPNDCSHMIVFAAMKQVTEEYVDRFLETILRTRGGTTESLAGYRGAVLAFLKKIDGSHLNWSTNQVYIALGQLLAIAATLGVDACPMEGIVPSQYDRLLGLEDSNFTTVVGCALGYRHDDDKYARVQKVRFDAHDVMQYY